MDQLTIKCPHCGRILNVPNQPGIEKAVVVCSNCKEKSRFVDCQPVILKQKTVDNDATQYGPGAGPSAGDETVTPADMAQEMKQAKPGKLIVVRTGSVYPLQVGNNTIGRAANSSQATIQIPDITERRQMSRSHAIVDVTVLADGNTRHTLRNWQNQNATLIDGTEVTNDDRIVLRNGQIIRMGDIDLRFEM